MLNEFYRLLIGGGLGWMVSWGNGGTMHRQVEKVYDVIRCELANMRIYYAKTTKQLQKLT